LIRECQDATRSRISFHPEGSIETVCQLCYQPEPGRLPLDLLKVESVSPILHIEFDLSQALAQPHINSNFAAIVGPVFCGIRQQFIQSQSERQRRLFRQRPGGRVVVDRNVFAKKVLALARKSSTLTSVELWTE
jgi:hypothetical protein